MPVTETVKRQAEEFGGFQHTRLPSEQISVRLCCAQFCSGSGRTQIVVPGGYRVLCGRHAVLVYMMTLGILGDPSPVGEVREYASRLGVDWERLLTTEPKHPTIPEHFSCLRCGGGYHVETIGMLAGKRYIHTCGE